MGGTVTNEDSVHIVVKDIAALVKASPFMADSSKKGTLYTCGYGAFVRAGKGQEELTASGISKRTHQDTRNRG